MKKTKHSENYEVVIIGGGPAGTATAIQLVRLGIQSVLIVEKGSYSDSKIGESLPPNTNVLLRQLGIWHAFKLEGHLQVGGSCSIWGSAESGYNDYFINPHGLGWHLDRNKFERFLANQACKLGAELRTKTLFESIVSETNTGFCLEIQNEKKETTKIQARFVVDASGAHAIFARKRGPSKNILDRLIFLSGFIEIPNAVNFSSLTMLEAVEYGWWYFAVLPGKRVIAALATDPEVVNKYELTKPEHWLALLRETKVLPLQLKPHLNLCEKIIASPALSSSLPQPCGPNWLAVGDAASSYDPICSLGIHKGLLTGMEAAKTITEILNNSNENALKNYHDFLETDFKKYKKSRDYFYGLENRWAHSPFWNRRKNPNHILS
ncbi:NAD(P)/FAD-dependent oxidoreductase [Flavivirga jejuensis]|nr:NAD(P)/FAD-dependent oxidoreductase [Flavivirga jejuensis]